MLLLNYHQFLFSILLLNITPSENLPAGTPASYEYLIVLAIGLLLLFKLISNYKNQTQKKTVKKKKITFQDIVLSKVGQLKQVGNSTYVGSKLISNKDDIETYLTVTKVDNSHIRREEQAKAKANYKKFKLIISFLIVVLILEFIILKYV